MARIGFLGGGQMARAMARGFVRAEIAAPSQLIASDPSADARSRMAAEVGCPTTADNLEAAAADIVILAVKPQILPQLLLQLQGGLRNDPLLVSVAAGVPLARLAAALGQSRRLVRVMPNTPCLVGASATAIALGGSATAQDAETVLAMFRAVGIAYQVPETLLDAVTGLSGSGPAYAYMVIEALSDGGVRAGLPRDVATALAAQTLLGAAKMVLDTGSHPAVLKDQVASPGGTTIAGLAVLEQGAVRASFLRAVEAAAERSRQLGQG